MGVGWGLNRGTSLPTASPHLVDALDEGPLDIVHRWLQGQAPLVDRELRLPKTIDER